jgi:hypothetical protein
MLALRQPKKKKPMEASAPPLAPAFDDAVPL